MKLLIDGPAGALQAEVLEGSDATAPFAVVCHPHPLMGGTMDNKVVTTAARALQSAGMPTIRFNFRGVGQSAGAYDGGAGETLDALSVARWGSARWPGRSVVLAGFSFGAYIALRAAQVLPVARLITIAPPLGRFDFAALVAPGAPWLVIQGEADEVVDSEAVRNWAEGMPAGVRLVMLPGVGHFFHGRLTELRERIRQEIRGDDASMRRPGQESIP
jgi:alpha/beta superfamily hydrolase